MRDLALKLFVVEIKLALKLFVVERLAEGFVLSPCANPNCEQLFSSGVFCSLCEEMV